MLPTHIEKTQEIQTIIKDKIANLETVLTALVESGRLPEVTMPLKHTFTDGIYVRECFIPAGSVIVGKIHKHSHLNFITFGTVTVLTKEGLETLVGPCSMISPSGVKRALYAHTDVIWTTVHSNPTNETDLEKLEENIISTTYETPIIGEVK
jgi:hypothetical protein